MERLFKKKVNGELCETKKVKNKKAHRSPARVTVRLQLAKFSHETVRHSQRATERPTAHSLGASGHNKSMSVWMACAFRVLRSFSK